MQDAAPSVRRDLEFFPVRHDGRQLILIRDHLQLVQEGKAIALPLYQFMTLLNGRHTVRDLQMEFMRQRGGVLVGSDEVVALLAQLDESYLLDSERFRRAREQIVSGFAALDVRPCSHCGQAYPDDPASLKERLAEIIPGPSSSPEPKEKVSALIAPHIDLAVGGRVYGQAYRMLGKICLARIVLLGVGHKMGEDLFCLTEKDFETPLGLIQNEKALVKRLREAGKGVIAADDFAHKSEHSIEFQLVFSQYLLQRSKFTIIPILCGSIQACLPEYGRKAYLNKAKPFLDELRQIIQETEDETLVIAGVDFSHIGPKFGHDRPADYLKGESERHDKKLLEHLCMMDADQYWAESAAAGDRFNVCGFSAMACLLEVLPPSRGELLDYQIWHEAPTQSAVSFAAVVFERL